jgi:phosphoglycerol transferase MdoB-like AlkP superfamily enzyme
VDRAARHGGPSVALPLVCGLVLVVLFQGLRCCLHGCNRDLAQGIPPTTLAWSYLVGLRFDFAVAACVLLAWLPVTFVARLWLGPQGERRAYVALAAAAAAIVTVLGLAEIEFYREFFTRYNSLALRYWKQPGTVASMIWHGYPVVRYLLLAAAATGMTLAAVAWLGRRWTNEPAPGRRPVLKSVARLATLAVVYVVVARGGLRGTPLGWGDAVHCDTAFANHLAQNGVWSLTRAVLESTGDVDRLAAMWPAPLPLIDAQARTTRLLVTPAASTAVDRRVTLARSPAGPPNVVVILMESFTARFCGACGAGRSQDDYTPEFDKLAAEGILFDRCFSAGSHTHQANVGVVAGFPILPGHEALMDDATWGAQRFDALPRAFRNRGYRTYYLYNGDLAWENMRGFMRLQGVEHFVDRSNFDASSRHDNTWGVTDEELFLRANREFREARAPFFAVMCTMSNHEPFDLPRPLPFPEVADQGSMNKRLNGIRYADWAIGRFFDAARQEPYFRNTLFVLVGDHGFSVAPILTELRLLRFHVPLLFYGPDLLGREGRRVHRVASHLDIAPTLLRLVGDETEHQHWGRDLFSAAPDDPGMAYFKPSETSNEAGWAVGDKLLVKTNDGQTRLYRYDLGFPAQVEPLFDEAIQKSLDGDLQAYLTAAKAALQGRAAAQRRESD